jgi:hypothetical protein
MNIIIEEQEDVCWYCNEFCLCLIDEEILPDLTVENDDFI